MRAIYACFNNLYFVTSNAFSNTNHLSLAAEGIAF